MTAPAFTERASAAYRRRLEELLESRPLPPQDPERAGRVAATMTAAAVAWDELIGPFLDTSGVQALLDGVSRQAVAERIRRRRLLALRTAGAPGAARWVYPRWQFEGRTPSLLPEILDAVGLDPARTSDGWMVASWLCSPDPRLDDLTPRDLLRAGHMERLRPLLGDVRYELGTDERAAAAGTS